MKIVNVTPLSRNIFKESLSYFSSQDIKAGYIVEIPLRNKNIDALVVSTEDLSSSKIKIKASDFKIRKISKVKSKKLFLPAFIEASQIASKYFATTLGSVLGAMTPKIFLDEFEILKSFSSSEKILEQEPEKFIFQANEDDRLATYKSLIRSEFAKKSSVFFCLPNIKNTEKALTSLQKGIADYVFVLHSKMTKKQLLEAYNKIMEEEHPILIIATGQFLSLPRNDIKTIIVEKESSKGYRTLKKPLLDIRIFAEILASQLKAKLILGDTFLRPETMWRYQNNELMELAPVKFRSLSSVNQKIIDMRNNKADSKQKFKIFGDEAIKMIKRSQENNESTFIFTLRRGLFPLTACGDCGSIVFCHKCNAPVVLHKVSGSKKDRNIFMCHKCGEQRDPTERCTYCKSWKLIPLGIGIAGAEAELKKKCSNIKIFRLDSDTATTPKKAADIIKKFNDNPGSVLLGTEMALSYINKNIDNGIILSIDSLFSIPNFRINERLLSLIMSIRSIIQHNFIIQTRNPEEDIFKYVSTTNLADFYRDEIKQREKFGYPPFKVFIKISIEGTKVKISKEISKLKDFLKDYNPEQFPSLIKTKKGLYQVNILIRLDRKDWRLIQGSKSSQVNQNILGKLLALPPSYKIEVDPENML